MSRRSIRLSAKSLIPEKVPSNSQSIKKNSRIKKTKDVITEPVEEQNASVEDQIHVKTPIKSIDSCYGSSSEDSNSTEESGTTIKTTYYNSPGKRKVVDEDHVNNITTTPPKQRKLSNGNEENKVFSPKTPSSLLSKLALTSPSNELDDAKNSSSRKSLWPTGNIYQDAKRALHSTTPDSLPGRQKELKELEFFIKEHLEEKRSGSLYISGPPGTGKTASLTLILEKAYNDQGFKKVYLNCTSIKSAGTIYSRIIKELGVKGTARNEKEYLSLIEKHFSKSKKMNLLVLDEMDQLESKNQSVLYTIFEWPARFEDNVVLIGIANALDLTDRILPRLQARCELKPKLLHFASYSKEQILEIITSRLKAADALKVFSPAALQMLAGKVAAVSGDIRRALDISRRVVDIIEKDGKADILQSIENINAEEVKTDIRKVDLKEVVGVLNKVYGTAQNLSDDCESDFPLQQKIVICSLLLILQKWKSKDVTIGKLHDLYKKICTRRNLFSVDQGEFVSLCSLIETKGIIRVIAKKEPRLHKVTLEWDQAEVLDALKDKVLISSILQDDTFLNRF